MGFFNRFLNRTRSYQGRRGYQGRHNFGMNKLDNAATKQREEELVHRVGKQAYEDLTKPTQASQSILPEPGYNSLIDNILWCGENGKLCLLEYINAESQLATRFIEYYSFRRTDAGNMLMYGWSYRDLSNQGIRSYRVDRIVTATPTLVAYSPKYEVELMVR